jgi:hypothetical protein
MDYYIDEELNLNSLADSKTIMTSGVQIRNKLRPSNALVSSENYQDSVIKPLFLSKEEREKLKVESEKRNEEFQKLKEIENKKNKKEYIRTRLHEEDKRKKKRRSRSRSRSRSRKRNKSPEKTEDSSKGLITEEMNAIKVRNM